MKRFAVVLVAGVLAASAVLLLSFVNYFDHFNLIAYDFTLRLAATVGPKSPVVIVAVDDATLDRYRTSQLPRDQYAQLLSLIEEGQPASVAFDVLFEGKTLEKVDRELAAAIADSPRNIVLAARIDSVSGKDVWRKPLERFLQPDGAIGHAHVDPDLDGITRSVFSAKNLPDGAGMSALSVEALRRAGVKIDPLFETEIGGATVVHPQKVGIRFAGDVHSFPEVPAWQVLNRKIPSSTFRDKIVLIGSTAEGLGDQYFTPVSTSGRKMSGVEIHANMIDALYTGRWIRQVPDWVVLVSLTGLVIFLWWFDNRFEGPRFYAMAAVLVPTFMLVSWALIKFMNSWMSFTPFVMAVVLVAPVLEARRLIGVNLDLDSKIEKLSRWGEPESGTDWNARVRISEQTAAGPQRDAWLLALQTFESGIARRQAERIRLFAAPWRNSRWRLGAVDFFSEDLVRFLSFNSAVLQSIEDVIIVSDVRGKVVYQNPAAHRLEKYEETPPFAPIYFASLLDGRDFADFFAKILAGQENVSITSVPAAGGRQIFNVTIAPIAGTGLVMSMHDATAQHELNLAKNEMVSLVSHELRTPLTSIRGYSDMLLKYDLVQDKGKPFLQTIVEESQRLNQLIQSFLDIAYIESGRQKVSSTEFEIIPLLRDMLAVLAPVASEKNIVLQGPPLADTRVRADRMLLHQALSNLVINAIKYSPSGTAVRLSVSNGDGSLRFHVSDQGCGIPREDATRIFEKFYRRSNRETQDQSGFGLGLAFVKEVAVRHGGEVTVESEVGKGSTFTLQIPL